MAVTTWTRKYQITQRIYLICTHLEHLAGNAGGFRQDCTEAAGSISDNVKGGLL